MGLDSDALLQTFMVESQEQLDSLDQALVALEERPGDREAIQTVFRIAHTLKGNAATLGFHALSELAHVMEDLLDRVRSGVLRPDASLISLLLRTSDALRVMLRAAREGQEKPTAEQAALMTLMKAAAAAAPASPRTEAIGAIPEPSAPMTAGAAEADAVRTLRVDMSRLDRMLDLVGEIVVARGRLKSILESAGRAAGGGLDAIGDADPLYAELHDLVTRLRMVPLGPLLRRQSRTVRDLATALGKEARLVVDDGGVEVDARLGERLRDPLTHMVRNALDHGIEGPEGRAACGKSPAGLITLRARHGAGVVIVEIDDDGRGLDTERILQVARERGLVGAAEAISERDAWGLVFAPGFSTAQAVTEVSGRGVGLDVVLRNVEALRGSVEIGNRPDGGCRVTIRLPLTLAILKGFAMRAAGETCVVPIEAVAESAEGPAAKSGDSGLVVRQGQTVPWLRLRRVLGLGGDPPRREHMVVVAGEGGCAGLVADELLGETQAVIKPLGPLLEGLPGVSASTILGDGRVALILDVPALLRQAAKTEGAGAL